MDNPYTVFNFRSSTTSFMYMKCVFMVRATKNCSSFNQINVFNVFNSQKQQMFQHLISLQSNNICCVVTLFHINQVSSYIPFQQIYLHLIYHFQKHNAIIFLYTMYILGNRLLGVKQPQAHFLALLTVCVLMITSSHLSL